MAGRPVLIIAQVTDLDVGSLGLWASCQLMPHVRVECLTGSDQGAAEAWTCGGLMGGSSILVRACKVLSKSSHGHAHISCC